MPYNILIVDDSRTTRAVISKTLKLSDIPVNYLFEAENGRVALGILDENWIDLVLADINMPEMDGVEMIDHMLKDVLLRTIPVVIVSTEGSQTRIEEMSSKGVRAYVRKPFTPELIGNIVKDILGEKDARKE